MRKITRISKGAFALLLSLAMVLTPVSGVHATEIDENQEYDDSNFFDYQGVPVTEEVATTQEVLSETTVSENNTEMQSPENTLEIEGLRGYIADSPQYVTRDAFASTTSYKGLQTVSVSDAVENGCEHMFFNLFLESYWADPSYGVKYIYNGNEYYFSDMSGIVSVVKQANARGITVTAQLMVKSSSTARNGVLIAPSAQSGLGAHTYYAPNVDSHFYQAEIQYLAQLFSQADCHIDNWVVGNEVNMPNSPFSPYTGYGTDIEANTSQWAKDFKLVYNTVRKYTQASRVSICVDHSWQHNDEGRGISTKDFLDNFAPKASGTDWCIAYHLYPAVLYEPTLWGITQLESVAGRDLNPRNESAEFVDGYNLYIMSNYIKNKFGSNHRIMLTEEGFSDNDGEKIQAASLALSYYAAKFNDMVDCFILNTQNAGKLDTAYGTKSMDFRLKGLASEVWKNLDTNQPYVESVTLPVIGIKNYSEVIPGYGRVVDKEKVGAFVDRLYNKCLGRDADEKGRADWVGSLVNGSQTGAGAAYGFFFSDELKNKNLSNEDFVELLYNVFLDRSSDAPGKANWVSQLNAGYGRLGVFRGFAESDEFNKICGSYGINRGTVKITEGRSRNAGVTAFVGRLYTECLGRSYDEGGLNNWCNIICDKKWSVNKVSTDGFFFSKEFLEKNTSNEEYVRILYATFLGREPDKTGYDMWVGILNRGEKSRKEVLYGFSNSDEFGKIKASFGL